MIVLPCGAGKTIVGLAAMAALQTETLVLTTSTTAVEQWQREILDKTDLDPALVGTYTGDSKAIGAGHPGHLPDRDLPAQEGRRLPPLPPVRRARLGADHLRRGPPAARAGLPDHRRHPGPPPAGADGDPGPRGRPRGGRLQPDRAQEVRRALARAGVQRVDRRGPVPRGPPGPARRRCGWNTPWPSGARSSAWPARTRSRTTWSRRCWSARRPGGPRAGHRPVPQAAAADRRAVRHPADHRPDARTPSARSSTTSSGAGRSAGWSSRRSATSPSTCPTPT